MQAKIPMAVRTVDADMYTAKAASLKPRDARRIGLLGGESYLLRRGDMLSGAARSSQLSPLLLTPRLALRR